MPSVIENTETQTSASRRKTVGSRERPIVRNPEVGLPVPFRCLSLDLEIGKKDGRIRAIGAARPDTGASLSHRHSKLGPALDQLDDMANGAEFILGHNLIEFDLPHLKATKPGLKLLKLPAVDTLRLSPLAFPANPYHHLVKHYQDGGLRRGQINDPLLDSRLALDVFADQLKALGEKDPDLLASWHWLTTPEPAGIDRALDRIFAEVRGQRRPSTAEARTAIGRRLDGNSCASRRREILGQPDRSGLALAYALAWLSVAGGNSVMPPWVRYQFPQAGELVRRLRDRACADPQCGWCRERHDADKELKRWFGFDEFRPEPKTDEGLPMQRAIVESAMAHEHVLGILPTGTGKSLCYQIPALSRYDKTGALTVVISPLVALMADQVAGLEARGIVCCVTVNGLLSMPERSNALDRIRLGDAGILLISPEQLRSRGLRRALDQREIGAWVLDEAHCLSRWGHDFRPDYRYVSRFIGQKAGSGSVPPILCLTATARPDVIRDIARHFHDRLGVELRVFDGGAERPNLTYEVMRTSRSDKFSDIELVLNSYLPPHVEGGAIVYCATRRQCEEVAEFLQLRNVSADHFHAGLSPEKKKEVQRDFIGGDLRVIAATNAFGMGIDKPDVRLVVHADIPGSLENYLQEAGRAGRDRTEARCVLLYTEEDVERQFGMSARSRLTRREIHGVLRALRALNRKKRAGGEVVATAGEILGEDEEGAFERDSNTDDTRVRTAVSWLEETQLLTREENSVEVFPSSLRVGSVEEAARRLKDAGIKQTYRDQLLAIATALIEAEPDEGVTTDELMGISGLSPEGVRTALHHLETSGIASNDTALTAFIHQGIERSSLKRLENATELETSLIAHLREAAPDLAVGDASAIHLRTASQTLRNAGVPDPLPERLWRIVRSLSYDGRGEDGSPGSFSLRELDAETARIVLRRDWEPLEQTAWIRRLAATRLLEHLLDRLPVGSRGTDLLAETTLGNLLQAIESDLVLKSAGMRKPSKLLDRALLWLHEQEVIRLNKGLAVFRPAMTIHLEKHERRGFSRSDFEPLDLHYKGQILQIHVMVEFAERGLEAVGDALRLTLDYFSLNEDEFIGRWMPGRDKEIGRQTTPASWRAIVESLRNSVQQRIVSDNRDHANVLVLAGPGSGKTRVLVHRIAYLVRARRENPRGILALAYNRHAAVEIRRRLKDLIGDDAWGVTVLTCHALAMRLAGASFQGRADRPGGEDFKEVLRRAVELLRGKELPPEEADERRERLLAGFRWILVDEYQDIDLDQYDLISALAGRTFAEEESKLTLFAVGDDDQNIYGFKGASVAFIRRFQEDYGARPEYLTANYRSTAHIVTAANAMIEPARERMKAGWPGHVDSARAKERPGGDWEDRDPVARGRVQILPSERDPAAQAQVVGHELLRMASLAPDWDWSQCAAIAREWSLLEPLQAFCELREIPVQMANEENLRFWRLRQTQAFVDWLRARANPFVDRSSMLSWMEGRASDPCSDLLRQAVEEFVPEAGEREVPTETVLEWLAEWGKSFRRRQQGLLLLTAHSAKGLEFDHVIVMDGGWDRIRPDEDPDAARRLYYVAMTRARQTLTLMRFPDRHLLLESLRDGPYLLEREAAALPPAPLELSFRRVRPPLNEIDIGFAGRRARDHRIHRNISALSPGDLLEVRAKAEGRWELLDSRSRMVGRLATGFKPPDGMRCREARVHAVMVWSKAISDPTFHGSYESDTWEVVVPEFVFEPAGCVQAKPGMESVPAVARRPVV